ncbi:periplasmic heavy metal sensor [Cognatishimia activa]|uniref:Putative integral membrane protein n=1 Tax=Cognatishimia activa TaxID=1715691 RepID=A0A0P1IQF2_9RHOB|nr:periplasmic heavy metal sensor [Cognatishimia activa]MEE2945895.1 periplasmic heavy metal sensor [Pseudomonadota bacterium]CUI90078.1 putative integral membrane protein [Cognatishimia activa]CUK25689.1 putative integral membrane protein [Cognatishimia activa]
MSDETPQAKTPMRRSLRVLLFASLAANLIVVGLVAGAVFGKDRQGVKPPRSGDFMGAYTRALPDEDRRAIGKSIREYHRKSGIGRDQARAQFQEMLAMLRATPFDAGAMTERLELQAQAAFDRRQAAQVFWLERVEAMSDAERQDYADQIEAQLKRLPRNKPNGKPDKPAKAPNNDGY